MTLSAWGWLGGSVYAKKGGGGKKGHTNGTFGWTMTQKSLEVWQINKELRGEWLGVSHGKKKGTRVKKNGKKKGEDRQKGKKIKGGGSFKQMLKTSKGGG